jgi:hypothetical protein
VPFKPKEGSTPFTLLIPNEFHNSLRHHSKRTGTQITVLIRSAIATQVRLLNEEELRDREVAAALRNKKKGSVIPAVADVPKVEYGDQRDVAAEAREQERATKEAERKPSGTVTRVKVPLPEIPKVPTLMPRWEPTPAPKDDDAPAADTVDKEDEDESG